jgi:ureidoglycolate hydrolase
MSKTTRKKNEEMALSKNKGSTIRFLKRQAEEREAQKERDEALWELVQNLGYVNDKRQS